MASLQTICRHLDRELQVETFEDASHNGLQVEDTGIVQRVCCGVDASLAFFEAAAAEKADLLICHHGISWGSSLSRITDLPYRRIKFLLEHDMALYACHLPLDAHRVYGNNACIARELELRNTSPFGTYHGQTIGVSGRLPTRVGFADLVQQVQALVGRTDPLQVMEFGADPVRTVAVVSGGAADMIMEAGAKGIDVLITGEPALSAYSMAQEYGVHVIYGGHYATETFGVRALGQFVQQQFDVPCTFVDMHIPF